MVARLISDLRFVLGLGVTGGLLVVIGWIMGEAARLADEHGQIV